MSSVWRAALKQAFREVDVNNDNSLNLDELRAVFQKQGGLSEKEIQQFLNDADQNGRPETFMLILFTSSGTVN